MSSLSYAGLEASVVAWAYTQSDIRAAVIVGSRARVAPAADEWSDLDLILFTTRPERYAADGAWLSSFGPLWLTHLDHTGRGEPEWYALYAGGLKADFVLHAVAPALSQAALPELIAASHYQTVYQRGVRTIFDRATPGALPALAPLPARPRPASPTAAEFSALMSAALFAAARTARLLQRGDLWRAKYQCDNVLKQHLLTLLEWHAQAGPGQGVETWDDGRHLERWAEPAALAALPAAFARYEAQDLWRALLATLDLITRLGHETAERLELPYPPAEPAVIAWLRSLRPPA